MQDDSESDSSGSAGEARRAPKRKAPSRPQQPGKRGKKGPSIRLLTTDDAGGPQLEIEYERETEPLTADVVVPVEAVTERLARLRRDGGLEVSLPPAQVRAEWAAQAPPRTGWTALCDVGGDVIADVAARGVAEVAQGAPEGAGGHAVADLRRRVWGRPIGVGGLPDAPAGLALGAHALGFSGPATLHSHGRWWRLATSGGYVLAR